MRNCFEPLIFDLKELLFFIINLKNGCIGIISTVSQLAK